jgi:hypothetical protein
LSVPVGSIVALDRRHRKFKASDNASLKARNMLTTGLKVS